MGLDNNFNVIKTQILATKPVPTLGTAYHVVAEDERQRAVSLENQATTEPVAFKAFQKCYFKPSKGKYTVKQEKENKQDDECTFCGRNMHKREGCFKLVGYPDWWPGKKDDKTKPKAACINTQTSSIPGLNEVQYQEFMKFFSSLSNNGETKPEANMIGNRDDVWVVDTGCTEYIIHKPDLLENKKGISNEASVIIPNGDAIPVDGKGDFSLPGGEKLKEGLRTRSLIGSGMCQGGLYLMDMFKNGRQAMMVTTDTWYKRLGHASKDKLSNVGFFKKKF